MAKSVLHGPDSQVVEARKRKALCTASLAPFFVVAS
jgi:hypothetical protein